MSDLRDEYGNPVGSTVDEYGNPIRYDEYGNPIRHGVYGGFMYGTDDSTGVTACGTDTGGLQCPGVTDVGIGGGTAGMCNRSTVSSASQLSIVQRAPVLDLAALSVQSEDDGQGGRRKKKGLKKKIKEKLPGGHKHGHEPHEHEQTAGYGATGYAGHDQTHHAKKGIMEKIKDKILPGHHKDEGHY